MSVLRCLECDGTLEPSGEELVCSRGHHWPVRGGTVRMLRAQHDEEAEVKRLTAESFAYEWREFGGLRDEWRRNFLEYSKPLSEHDFDGVLLLDVGCGSGRHSRQASELGATVAAVDSGASIDVARANLPPEVLTVQADAEDLPFQEGAFDIAMSIGVLHHLPDPERAFRSIVRYVRPGGRVHVYLYWWPPVRWQRVVLRGVNRIRRLTTRMPHRLLHAACYPLAGALWLGVVQPYRILRRLPALRPLADQLPLRTYADYPFGVLVNDQFDRFSAPIENRYEREEVERWLRDAGLVDFTVRASANAGWVGSGVRPDSGPSAETS